MAAYVTSPPRSPHAPLSRPVDLICVALVVAQSVYLVTSYLQGVWLTAPDGGGIPTDFVNVWAAGKLVLAHHAAAAYDWPTHKAVEVTALGHPFDGYFGWHYPPPFMAVAALLALLPYTLAFIVWAFCTFPAYLIAMRAIIGERSGLLLAAAFPAVLPNFIDGQNGFLSAALFGGALVLLVDRPILAGVCIGLLTYKPHLGLLIPVALVAGGHWRVIAAAAAVAILMALLSWAAFGTSAWLAFIGNIGHTSQAFLANGWADFGKLQTAFGLTRTLGFGESAAWAVQATVTLTAAAAIVVLWRSDAAYGLKAAALGAGAMLATPYLYTYDLVVLAVPLAFLWRMGRTSGFLRYELGGIALACLMILIFPFVTAPVGLAAVLIVAALIVRRALSTNPLAPAAA
jgi:arabinofuranan 3-O-arabinosyltransferase